MTKKTAVWLLIVAAIPESAAGGERVDAVFRVIERHVRREAVRGAGGGEAKRRVGDRLSSRCIIAPGA